VGWDWIRTLYIAADAVLDFNILPLQQLMAPRPVQVFHSEKRRLAGDRHITCTVRLQVWQLLAAAYRSSITRLREVRPTSVLVATS
jgi:hypothetical protein